MPVSPLGGDYLHPTENSAVVFLQEMAVMDSVSEAAMHVQ
jgi:hypothetical protein